MSEYIERKRAIASFEDADADVCADYGAECGCEYGFSINKAKEIIQSITVADVEPVRHGYWILERQIDDITSDFKCSVCDYDDTFYSVLVKYHFYKYCPYCGAKMDFGETNSVCSREECEHQEPSNADIIRAMDDEKLARFLAYTWATSARAWQKDYAETLYWLQQLAEEEPDE